MAFSWVVFFNCSDLIERLFWEIAFDNLANNGAERNNVLVNLRERIIWILLCMLSAVFTWWAQRFKTFGRVGDRESEDKRILTEWLSLMIANSQCCCQKSLAVFRGMTDHIWPTIPWAFLRLNCGSLFSEFIFIPLWLSGSLLVIVKNAMWKNLRFYKFRTRLRVYIFSADWVPWIISINFIRSWSSVCSRIRQ